ncbi:MAG: hypothetical protein ACPGKS_07580 [Coraliomargarita sp.]
MKRILTILLLATYGFAEQLMLKEIESGEQVFIYSLNESDSHMEWSVRIHQSSETIWTHTHNKNGNSSPSLEFSQLIDIKSTGSKVSFIISRFKGILFVSVTKDKNGSWVEGYKKILWNIASKEKGTQTIRLSGLDTVEVTDKDGNVFKYEVRSDQVSENGNTFESAPERAFFINSRSSVTENAAISSLKAEEAVEEVPEAEPAIEEEPAELVDSEPVEEDFEPSSNWWLWLIGAVVVVGGISLVLRRKNESKH